MRSLTSRLERQAVIDCQRSDCSRVFLFCRKASAAAFGNYDLGSSASSPGTGGITAPPTLPQTQSGDMFSSDASSKANSPCKANRANDRIGDLLLNVLSPHV